MQAMAAEFSGCRRKAPSLFGVSANRVRSRHSEATAEFRCSFERKFKNSLFDLCNLKSGS